MTFYDYKVIPAPKQLKRVKGVKTAADLFCVTLAEAINAAAREGWEYIRAESLPALEGGGWFRRGHEVIETVLVFRRPRESLSPRIAAQRAEPAPEAEASRFAAVERPPPDRVAAPLRREPRLNEAAEGPKPLRPSPRLGPAEPR